MKVSQFLRWRLTTKYRTVPYQTQYFSARIIISTNQSLTMHVIDLFSRICFKSSVADGDLASKFCCLGKLLTVSEISGLRRSIFEEGITPQTCRKAEACCAVYDKTICLFTELTVARS